jgi:hypothetical protein
MTTKLTELSYARFAPESGHWYSADGKVVDAVPSADGKKMVKPDRRHAKKFGLVVGTTTVSNQLKAAGLDYFKQQQLLMAAMTLPVLPNEPDEMRAMRILADAEAQAEAAANVGTLMHAALNRYFCEGLLPDNEPACNAVHAVDAWLRVLGATEIKGEVGFANADYGGTADLTFRIGPMLGVADFKTVEDAKLTNWKPYDSHGWQLAGYGKGLGGVPSDRYWNIAIGRGSGLIAPYEWPDMTDNFEAFGLLLRLWQIRNKWNVAAQED